MQASWLLAILLIFLGILYAFVVAKRAWVYQSADFLGEVKGELKKVTWPGRREVLGTTGVVIATVFFFSVFLSVVDLAVRGACQWIFAQVTGGPR